MINNTIEDYILILKDLVKHSKLPTDSVLRKDHVIDWCFFNSSFVKSLDKNKEREWGQTTINSNTKQWTTKLSETIVKELLILFGKESSRPTPKKGENGKQLKPDWETYDAIYEVKCRTYTINGTAGEKILATPWKYMELPKLYNKPLYIVLVAYQEQEADEKFCLFQSQNPSRQTQIQFFKEMGIQYKKLTDLMKELIEKHDYTTQTINQICGWETTNYGYTPSTLSQDIQ